MAVRSVQADMAFLPVFVNDRMQKMVPLHHTTHLVNVGIQTEVVEQATAILENGTPCDPVVPPPLSPLCSTFIISQSKVTIDTDIQKSMPTSPAVVVVDGKTQTDTLTESTAICAPPLTQPDSRETLQHCPCAPGIPNIFTGGALSGYSADEIDFVADSLGSGSASDSMHAPKGPAAHQSSCVLVSKSPGLRSTPLGLSATSKGRSMAPGLPYHHLDLVTTTPVPQAACSIFSLATSPVPVNPSFTPPLKDIIKADSFISPRPVPIASGGSLGAPVRLTLACGKPGSTLTVKKIPPRSRVVSVRISPMQTRAPSEESAAAAIVLPAKRRGHRPVRAHATIGNDDDMIDWARA
jgi:hypothetical protein